MTTQTTPLPTIQARPKSEALFQTAQGLMPGGVNSPVRAFKSVGGGTPVVVAKAEGPYLWDVDGHQYIDYVNTWGPAIVGHAHPDVIAAVQATAANGLSFGAPTEHENLLAAKVIELVPSIEMIRFTSSGTEAAMSVIRLARAYTGRQKLIKFAGCYHGHADALLVKAGSGALTMGVPDSAGVSPTVAQDTLTATFNDLDTVEALLTQYPGQIAAILVEPVAGNMGCVLPQPGFLQGLRALADTHGALLVFDEVMTGFRVSLGGAQAHYGVQPDITALGKVIGGGLPVGAYGASKAIMQTVAPLGPMYQGGTLSGNPLGMVAGLTTLNLLQSTPNAYPDMAANTARLVEGMKALFTEAGIPVFTTQVGAMFSVFFSEQPVNTFDEVMACNRTMFNRFFWTAHRRGIYWAPSPFEAGFTSMAHTPEVVDDTLNRMADVVNTLKTPLN
jgi:glutamate-1-semialdehyde 2,1-aminomutase